MHAQLRDVGAALTGGRSGKTISGSFSFDGSKPVGSDKAAKAEIDGAYSRNRVYRFFNHIVFTS